MADDPSSLAYSPLFEASSGSRISSQLVPPELSNSRQQRSTVTRAALLDLQQCDTMQPCYQLSGSTTVGHVCNQYVCIYGVCLTMIVNAQQ
jgi:hypothetical protein